MTHRKKSDEIMTPKPRVTCPVCGRDVALLSTRPTCIGGYAIAAHFGKGPTRWCKPIVRLLEADRQRLGLRDSKIWLVAGDAEVPEGVQLR